MIYDFDWALVARIFPKFLPAIWTTIELFVLAQILSSVIAISFAVMNSIAGAHPARRVFAFYSWMFRGLPELVVLMFCFMAPPSYGIHVSPLVSAVAGLALIASAYEYEVLRGAFASIPAQQYEAARALGYPRLKMYRRIILPQVMRVALSPILTFSCTSLKRTSIASAVAVVEVMGMTRRLIDVLQKPFELMLIAVLSYLVMSSLIMGFEVFARRRVARRTARAA